MDVITPIATNLTQYVRKRQPQNFLDQHTLDNLLTTHIYVRRWRWITSNAFRTLEVKIVMAPAAAEGNCQRDAAGTPAGTPDSLLIVEPSRWHVCHHYCVERADINTRFHSGGHAEQVNTTNFLDFSADEDLLKPALPARPICTVSLAG
jgi:hypothetical protein